MATWNDMAVESYSAAGELYSLARWRNCVSRSYYAVYCRIAGLLTSRGVAMPMDREGPNHKKLPVLVETQLSSLRQRWLVSQMLQSLYGQRLTADYRPSETMSEADARRSVGMMVDVFQMTKESNHG